MYSVVAILLVSALTASIGQVAFKKGMIDAGQINIEFSFTLIKKMINVIFTPYVFAGLIFYVASTLLWLTALSKCSLNFAYPFTAVTFVLVILFSALRLKEPIPISRIIGISVIIGGVFIVSLK